MLYFYLNKKKCFKPRRAVSVRTATVVIDRIERLGFFCLKKGGCHVTSQETME